MLGFTALEWLSLWAPQWHIDPRSWHNCPALKLDCGNCDDCNKSPQFTSSELDTRYSGAGMKNILEIFYQKYPKRHYLNRTKSIMIHSIDGNLIVYYRITYFMIIFPELLIHFLCFRSRSFKNSKY